MTARTLNLDDSLYQYLLDVSLRETSLLKRLRDETQALPMARWQVAPEQGQFLALLVKLTGAKRLLEVGTFTGYSALCMAQALPDDGTLLCCDIPGDYNATAKQRTRALLAKVGLNGKESAYPRRLSGGQQQRVAIARALAMQPEVILFDEPTSALDPELVGEVLNTIRSLAEEKRTMVIVTHEMSFARDVADRAIFMDHGRIVEQGPAKELFANPQHQRTQQFLDKFLNQ